MAPAPSLRFPGFDEPWSDIHVADIGTIHAGLSGKSGDDFGDGEDFATYRQIYENSALPTTGHGKVRVAKGEKQFELRYGDIAFTASSETPDDVGWSCVVGHQPEKIYLNSFCFALRPSSPETLLPGFAAVAFRAPAFRRRVVQIAQGTTRFNISKREFARLDFKLPSIGEQGEIAALFELLDEKIVLAERRVRVLFRLRTGAERRIFLEGPLTIEGWREATLGDVGRRLTARNRDLSVTEVLTNSARDGVVRQRDYFDKAIASERSLDNYYVVPEGAFVYNPRISADAPVGPISRNHIGVGIVSPLYTVFEIADGDPDFYECYFRSGLWADYIRSVSNQGARSDRMNVTVEGLNALPLPQPPRDDQTRIAVYLNALGDRIALAQEKVAALTRLRLGLMQQMIV